MSTDDTPKIVEMKLHWSGLAWHKKKVRAKYRREEARWRKAYFSRKHQAYLQQLKKDIKKAKENLNARRTTSN